MCIRVDLSAKHVHALVSGMTTFHSLHDTENAHIYQYKHPINYELCLPFHRNKNTKTVKYQSIRSEHDDTESQRSAVNLALNITHRTSWMPVNYIKLLIT